jgi:23S rRNA (cytidine1920-2'-O)/16S rRNA (cytidine1409-2'-O)-methyltransferase
MTRRRLDILLLERGLFESRTQARAAIEGGLVRVDGVVITKPGRDTEPDARIEAEAAFPWVSRAGLKLAHAIATWAIPVAGRQCLDLGSSTGGFSEVLLANGAAAVTAVDVGSAQFHPRLRNDPRIRLHEGTDARALLADHFHFGPPDLIVADLSFIGLAKALPVPLSLAAPAATLVTLVKPQFEAGTPERIGKGGLVDPALAPVIAQEAIDSLNGLEGFAFKAMIDSPVTGGDGNREYLAWFQRG